MLEVTYTAHIEPAEDGGYVAWFPALPGCQTQGRTLEEVIAMAKDALAGYLAWLQEDGEPLPVETPVSRQVVMELPVSASLPR
jgi:predicted RNase H-like HicB family nuclease